MSLMRQDHLHSPRASNIPSFYPDTISSVFIETSDEESLQLLLNGITVVSGPSTIDNSLQLAVKNNRAQKNFSPYII